MLTIRSECSLDDFKPWSGAVSTYERIVREGKLDRLEAELDALYDGEMTDTQLNDLLWFEPDEVYRMCGMRNETDINEEIEELRDEQSEIENDLDTLHEDFESDREGMTEAEAAELWADMYADDVAEKRERAAEIEKEIEELEEEKRCL